MGGAIALQTAISEPSFFDGVILSGPCIAFAEKLVPPAPVLALLKVLGKIFPKMRLDPVDAKLVSRDPVVVAQYDNDPLCWHGGLTAGLALEIMRGMEENLAQFDCIEWPFLLMYGSDDGLCAPSGAEELFRRSPSKDKTKHVFQGWLHEIFNEHDDGTLHAVEKLVSWVSERS
jgi:acylglycerol lipase